MRVLFSAFTIILTLALPCSAGSFTGVTDVQFLTEELDSDSRRCGLVKEHLLNGLKLSLQTYSRMRASPLLMVGPQSIST